MKVPRGSVECMFNMGKNENYKTLKVLKLIFSLLVYIAAFTIVMSAILVIILALINVGVENMMLPPFMKKVIDSNGDLNEYIISLGNGVKISVPAEQVSLSDIKKVFTSGLFVLAATMMTVGAIFKFLSLLLDNIIQNIFFTVKNSRLIMYMGLTIFVGNTFTSFISNFYNYYLLKQFMKDTAQEIYLSLTVNLMSGLPGLLIIFIGFLFGFMAVRVTGKNTEA